MAVYPTDRTVPLPESSPTLKEESVDRRRFLQVLGAVTAYTAPALVALLGDSRPAGAQTAGSPVTGNSSESSESSESGGSGGSGESSESGGSGESSESSEVIADPGPDQTVTVRSSVTLDGSNSTNTASESSSLSYFWEFASKPLGSNAFIENADQVTASFEPDLPGNYSVRLTVSAQTNSEQAATHSATVTISTTNSAPIADAGSAQTVHPVVLVSLDGTQSYDPDGHSITYSWTLDKPPGSTASLSNPSASSPSFTADVPGTYTATLVVNDSYVNSDPASVIISTSNSAPVANAGLSSSTLVGSVVPLDGSGSSDADNDSLTYTWSFLSLPAGSGAVFSDPHGVAPAFVADKTGTYVVGLIVNDGFLDSSQSTRQVLATVDQSVVVTEIQDLQEHIGSLTSGDFKNRQMQNALLNKANAVVKTVSEGDYVEAIEKLRNDIGTKVGTWITNSGAAQSAHLKVQDIISLLEAIPPA